MSIIIRLQNLPWAANSVDIRRYFAGLSIPEGGVHIVGGEKGDAFIAFSTDEDARLAMEKDGGKIKEMKIKLLLSSRSEMMRVIEQARNQNLALQNSSAVIIFSLQGSGHFQGLARFTCHIADQRPSEFSAPNISTCYRIEWLKRGNIPFQSTRHLLNSWNDNRKVQISRDGQELEPSVGESLCKLWDKFNFPTPASTAMLGNKFDSYNNPLMNDRVLTHSSQVSCPSWYKSLPTATAPVMWSQSRT